MRGSKNLTRQGTNDAIDVQQPPVLEPLDGLDLQSLTLPEVFAGQYLTAEDIDANEALAGAISTEVVEHHPASVSNNLIFTAMPGPRLGGRPAVFSDTLKQQACALLATGLNFREVAGYLGCSRTTLHTALKQDQDFARTASAARQAATAQQLLNIAAAGKQSWKAAVWLLEYVERRQKVLRGKRRQKKQAQAKIDEEKAERERMKKDQRNMNAFNRRHPELKRFR